MQVSTDGRKISYLEKIRLLMAQGPKAISSSLLGPDMFPITTNPRIFINDMMINRLDGRVYQKKNVFQSS